MVQYVPQAIQGRLLITHSMHLAFKQVAFNSSRITQLVQIQVSGNALRMGPAGLIGPAGPDRLISPATCEWGKGFTRIVQEQVGVV